MELFSPLYRASVGLSNVISYCPNIGYSESVIYIRNDKSASVGDAVPLGTCSAPTISRSIFTAERYRLDPTTDTAIEAD